MRFVSLLATLLAAVALPALGARHHEVEIATPVADVRLAGTLSLPDGVERPPLVVFVQGTGPHTRDQTISRAPMFKEMSEHLLANGIATLRMDVRGAGASTGEGFDRFTTADRAADVRATLDWVQRQSLVVPGAIGLLGHSEGAAIAAEVAADADAVDWVILLGAPARPGHEVWVDQQLEGARSELPDDAAVARVESLLRETAGLSSTGADAEAIEPLAVELFMLAGVPEAQARADGLVDNYTSRMTGPWMRYFLAHDPSLALRRLAKPVLLAWGSLDRLTRPAANATPLLEALLAAGNADVSLHILPDQDHFFLRGEGVAPGKHEAGKMHVAPALLGLLSTWIRERS